AGMNLLGGFWNSPIGPKTSRFWGPVTNWGIPTAGLQFRKPAWFFAAMCVYSLLYMRFAWMVQPRNLLLACHASNETVQLYQLSRWMKPQG
ncbi:hypothetical protein POUND7_017422, partial [Theobroma cacao]